MNGEPLPLEHGFPVRMVVPGLYGYVSATKWLVDLELTTFDAFDAYWIRARLGGAGADQDRSRGSTLPKPLATRARRPGRGRGRRVGAAPGHRRGRGAASTTARGSRRARPSEDTIDTWRQWVSPWDATPATTRSRCAPPTATARTQTATRRADSPTARPGQESSSIRGLTRETCGHFPERRRTAHAHDPVPCFTGARASP